MTEQERVADLCERLEKRRQIESFGGYQRVEFEDEDAIDAAADQKRLAENVLGQLSDLYLATHADRVANLISQDSDYEGLNYGDGGPGGTVTSDKNQQLELATHAKKGCGKSRREKPVG